MATTLVYASVNDRWPGLHLFGLLRLSFVVSLFKKSIHFLGIPEDDEPFGDKPKAENSEIHIFLENLLRKKKSKLRVYKS